MKKSLPKENVIKDFEKHGSLKSKIKAFEENMSLRELAESELYMKMLKQAERFERKMRKSMKILHFKRTSIQQQAERVTTK